MEFKEGDWVIWTAEAELQEGWLGRRMQIAKIERDSTGVMIFFHKPEWYTGSNWSAENGWYSHRVRKDETYEVELLLKEYDV